MCRDGDTFLTSGRRLQVDLTHPPSFSFQFLISSFRRMGHREHPVLRHYFIDTSTSSAFLVQIDHVTEAQSGLRLSTLCNQCRADTDRRSIGSTVSGRPHELRLSSKNTAHGAYLHDYCPRGTSPTGWTHETSPAGICSKAACV